MTPPAADARSALAALVAVLDLTSLEATDGPARVRELCARALRPVPSDAGAPPVAAVCVWPSLAGVAREALGGAPVRVACVAGAFPSGQTFLATKVDEVRRAVEAGADEVDVPFPRGLLLAGERDRVADELAALRDAAGSALLKVILETGELGSDARVREAARLALETGADFAKTSTGKIAAGATPEHVRALLEVARDVERETGRRAGVKAAGGIRTAADGLGYLALAREVRGEPGALPERFRIGASSLLDDVAGRWPT